VVHGFGRSTARACLLMLTMCAVSCEDPTNDDWGPPLGYTVVSGTVRSRSGPNPELAQVGIGRCQPENVLGAGAKTDANGRYEITASTPPFGLLPLALQTSRPDTLNFHCFLFVYYDGVIRDSLDVKLGPSANNPTRYSLDLWIP